MEWDRLTRAVGAVLSASVGLKRRAEDGKKALAALAERASGAVKAAAAPFLVPPEGPEGYLAVGRHVVAKHTLLLAATALLAAGTLLATVVYPWMDGRLWPSRLTLGSEKAADFTGRVELYTVNGTRVYEGPMVDGQLTGTGAQYGPDGQLLYRGGFSEGRYEGQGRYYEDGVLRYAGGFHENDFSGQGAQYDGQGRLVYQGGFTGGQRSGSGAEFAPDTGLKRYVGGFLADQREGRGTEYGPDGETVHYQGEFSLDAYSGAGRLYWDGGLYYDGGFLDGDFSGGGVLYDPDTGRVRYEGEFRVGLPDGAGRLYDPETGKLVYAGTFAAGVRSGEGTEYDSLGREVFSGMFRDGMVDLMHYLGRDVADFRADFGPETTSRTVGDILLLLYPEQNLAVICRDGARCWKLVSGLSTELAGVRRGADPAEVRAALGEPFTALSMELGGYYGPLFGSLGAPLAADEGVYAEKYLRGGYFIRVYYSGQGKAAAVELCATGGT